MLYGINTGDVHTTHRESITDPIHVLPIDSPSSARPTSLFMNELYILSCFLVYSSLTDAQNVLLAGTLSLLTCDYAAGLVLYSLYVIMSMCHSLLLFSSLMDLIYNQS